MNTNKVEVVFPRGLIPKDIHLWDWCFENFGGEGKGDLGRVIWNYRKQYKLKNFVSDIDPFLKR